MSEDIAYSDETMMATDLPSVPFLVRLKGWGKNNLSLVVIFVAFVVLWEAAVTLLRLPPQRLPHTYDILREFLRHSGRGELILTNMARNALMTWFEAAVGFTLGSVLGFLFAIAFDRSRLLERGVLPYVIASQTVPILVVAPMVVVGVGRLGAPPWLSKALIAAYLTFFPVTVNTLTGLKSVDRDSLALMHSYAATEREIFLKLRIPSTLPYLFTALKISATASVVGAIIGELPVGSTIGLGVAIINGAQYFTFQPHFLWAAILAASMLGMGFYWLVALAERRVVVWQIGQ